MDWQEEARLLARRAALANAVEHGGRADPKAIVGKMLGANPSLRPHARDLGPLVTEVVTEVNALGADAQQAALLAAGGAEKREKKVRAGPLKPLPGVERHDTLVMRFAPNPNGPATLGHSRGMCTLSIYRKMYEAEGKKVRLILRYDDTDPQVKPPDPAAYGMLLDDWRWLGEEPDVVLRASDRIPVYYAAAEALIGRGGAYMCFCSQEVYKPHREGGTACPHREAPAASNLASWKEMLAGRYKEGEAVLRVKTEVDHPDPALRDWVAFRVATTPHPMVGTRYRVWPMLDFESAVEDREQGVTHIIRGKDLIDSTRRQTFLYKWMDWAYPETLYWGRVRLHEHGKFSSSGMGRDIKAGKFAGWDDIRLPTLMALRRRGYQPQAIWNFWIGLGLSEKDVAASVANLEHENRRVVEPTAPRLFFVPEPRTLKVQAPEPLKAHAPIHPDHPEMGTRETPVKGGDEVALPSKDLADLAPGVHLRLKDLGNFSLHGDTLRFESQSHEVAVKERLPILQWCATRDAIPATVLVPEDEVRAEKGLVESLAATMQDRVVQFERYGFVRLEKAGRGGVEAIFAHR